MELTNDDMALMRGMRIALDELPEHQAPLTVFNCLSCEIARETIQELAQANRTLYIEAVRSRRDADTAWFWFKAAMTAAGVLTAYLVGSYFNAGR